MTTPHLHRDSTPEEVTAVYESDAAVTISALADRCGRSPKWVRDRLHKGNAQMRPQGRRRAVTRDAALAAYREHGTVAKAADALGVEERALSPLLRDHVKFSRPGRPRDEWPAERVETELRAFCSEHGGPCFPTRREFRDAKRYALLHAVSRTGGAAHWSKVMGLPVRPAGRIAQAA